MRESLRKLTMSSEHSENGPGAGLRRVRIQLLDGDHINVDVPRKARGGELLDRVCESLDLVEKDYFGLLHQLRGDPRVWVDLNKRLSKTFRNEPWDVRFAVKYYPPEPSELQDDVTRYQLTLAVRQDLTEGRLSCSLITHALLASYSLQAERGDLSGRLSPGALPAPHEGHDDLCGKVEELYRKHRGQTPAEAELNFLENAKKLALYGAAVHQVLDSTGAPLQLAISAAGIAVYRDGIQMHRFPWAKISKISYNKRQFELKFRAAEFEPTTTQLGFLLGSSRAARALWRASVDHHVFFRRSSPVPVRRSPLSWGSRQSSCRRTLRQLRHDRLDTMLTV